MPEFNFIHSIQLPELKIVNKYHTSKDAFVFQALKESFFKSKSDASFVTPAANLHDVVKQLHVSFWLVHTAY
jgi:hypothetical protein